ncbi:ubiquinol-cytochrome c reductase [Cardiosporidium cionae]|uniref:Ubiquinol-cytochrome c reductase n=1 Tax=Cardiosporidium cionae TaxID=476202 RepID=A0ABQ7JFP5_9APIC|nr:ubiquinol-cytochrome c reductase [Cardiosporidium cionae]|eukprot:KAF8822791.1 ubiquinol-cytochrome c reductase [Cardiosporidium cionae]
MSLHKELAKLIALNRNVNIRSLTKRTSPPGFLSRFYINWIYPTWFQFVQAPIERWNFATISRYLRHHGMMYDDCYNLQEPVIDRAISLLPADLATARYRRLMRGQHLNLLRLYLPLAEQNYDPFIPYLAPYIEEAKFQMQEEEELLGYHPHDRRIFSGSNAGFSVPHPDQYKVLAPSQLSYTRHYWNGRAGS